MARISKRFQGMTMVNTFEPPESHMGRLEALLIATSEAFASEAAGFVSANLHLSADGKRMVNYAQWESAADFQRVTASELGRGWFDRINEICKPDVLVCSVTYVSDEPWP